MNITLIDDHQLLSELLKISLSNLDFIKSVQIYNQAEQFFSQLNTTMPDLLILDMIMPDANGVEVIRKCRKIKSKSEMKILVLSTITNPNIVKEAFKAGANGYLCKNTSIEQLLNAIKFINLNENQPFIGESIKEIMVQSQLFENSINVVLSPREKELLNLVCSGKTVKEMAARLELSSNTIQSYMRQLMFKMEVNRTPDLILKAIEYGLFIPYKIL